MFIKLNKKLEIRCYLSCMASKNHLYKLRFTRIKWEIIKMFTSGFMSINGYFTCAWQCLLIRLFWSFNLYLKTRQLFERTDNKYYYSSENEISIRIMDIATISVTN